MKLERLKATACFAFLVLSLARYGLSAEQRATMSEKEARATSVLFEHFETVFHTVPRLLTNTQSDSAIGFAREPFGYVVLALDHKSRELRTVLLGNSEAVLLGTKDYAPPDGLGRVISTRCYIAVLREGRGSDFSKYLGEPTLKSPSGHPVWSWSVDLGEFGDRTTRKSTIYATQVGEDYFIVANSLNELQNISYQMSSATRGGFALSDLRDWDTIENREFWAYRKYKHAGSRPAATVFNGLKGIQPDAEGLILYVDFEHQRGVLRLFSTNPDDPSAGHLHDMWRMPPAKSIGSGEWEMLFPLSESDPEETSFQAWWLLGMGTGV